MWQTTYLEQSTIVWPIGPGRAPPQRSLSLLLGSQLWAHLLHSAASHFVMSLWGFRGRREREREHMCRSLFATWMISNRREESCFPKAWMTHCWPLKAVQRDNRVFISMLALCVRYLQRWIHFSNYIINITSHVTEEKHTGPNHLSSPGTKPS